MKLPSPPRLRHAAALVLSAALVAPVHAALVNSRVELGATDAIDWAQLGAAGTLVAPLTAVLSMQGLGATVSPRVGTTLVRQDQGAAWGGNFAPGAALLRAGQVQDSMVVQFAQPIAGGGVQLQASAFGPFSGWVEAYDDGGQLLERWERLGLSTAAADDSALFVGLTRNVADIRRLHFGVQGLGFAAINRLDLVTSVVPEPSSVALLGAGIAALVVLGRRRPAGAQR
jgi:hypothetical protein